MKNSDAKEEIARYLEENSLVKTVSFRLRRGISRQRYWAPIPVIHCEKCGSVPAPESTVHCFARGCKPIGRWTISGQVRVEKDPLSEMQQ